MVPLPPPSAARRHRWSARVGSGFLGLTPPGYELAPRSGLEAVLFRPFCSVVGFLIRGNRSRVEGDKRAEAHGAAKIPPGCVGRCDRRGFQEKQDRRPESPNPAPRHCDYVCTNSSDVLETPHVKNPISPRLRQVLLISSVVLLPVLGYFRPAHLPDRVNPVHLRIVALRPVPLVMEVRLQP